MKEMEEFQKQNAIYKAHLDEIGKNIKYIERALKDSPLEDSAMIVLDKYDLRWDASARRVMLLFEGMDKPLIEHRAAIRNEISPFLSEFMAKVTQKLKEQKGE